MSHSFATSLKKGQLAEEQFLQLYPQLIRTDGRKQDFLTASGKKVELKADSYDATVTPNCFMEIVSHEQNLKLGGPFQSLANGTDFYAYYFPVNGCVFVYNVPQLCARLLLLANKKQQRRIKNAKYDTVGLIIDRQQLADLELQTAEAFK